VVGRRGEVEKKFGREFWGKEDLRKKKPMRARICSSAKRVQRAHPQLVHCWLLVHSNPNCLLSDFLDILRHSLLTSPIKRKCDDPSKRVSISLTSLCKIEREHY
jgi:hypothetical protein